MWASAIVIKTTETIWFNLNLLCLGIGVLKKGRTKTPSKIGPALHWPKNTDSGCMSGFYGHGILLIFYEFNTFTVLNIRIK